MFVEFLNVLGMPLEILQGVPLLFEVGNNAGLHIGNIGGISGCAKLCFHDFQPFQNELIKADRSLIGTGVHFLCRIFFDPPKFLCVIQAGCDCLMELQQFFSRSIIVLQFILIEALQIFWCHIHNRNSMILEVGEYIVFYIVSVGGICSGSQAQVWRSCNQYAL